MILGGVDKLNDLWSFLIKVRLVVGLVIDFLGWVDQLADVDACSVGLVLDELDQVLQVLLQVSTLLHLCRAEESVFSLA